MEKYKNPQLPPKERAEDLLRKMTVKEKAGQLNQNILGWCAVDKGEKGCTVSEAFKDEVAVGDGLGAVYGIFRADPWSGIDLSNAIALKDNPKVANMLQRYVMENTRLGIPILFSEECPHGHQAIDGTIFPVNLAVGCSFNPALYKEEYVWISEELRARGATMALISCLDIACDPRWGRTEECYGEDPYLAAKLAQAAVEGLQGANKNADRGIAAVVKHFCAQGAAVGGHNGKHTIIGERELREIHLPAMAGAIKGGALSCMAAYNDIDGVYCHANRHLLTDILRGEMGFDGVVMSDGCAIDMLQNITGDELHSAAMALHAGVDLNLWSKSYTRIAQAVESGIASEKDLDEAVLRVLTLKFKLGLFEHPYVAEDAVTAVSPHIEKDNTNLEIARQGAVLIKNNGLLPLQNKAKEIAVIGPNADNVYNQLGDYTPQQRRQQVITLKDGMKKVFSDCTVTYAEGCKVRGEDESGFAEAISAAQKADVVILALGSSSAREVDLAENKMGAANASHAQYMDCGEGVDKANLFLEDIQLRLFRKIAKLNKPLVTVMIEGRPNCLTEIEKQSDAILIGWYPGIKGGQALAEIIRGDINPSGKLSVSVPVSSAQLPVYYNYKSCIPYVDMEGTAAYPFGYGLSYTHFAYSEPTIDKMCVKAENIEKGQKVTVCVNVKNTGRMAGYETVQLYIHGLISSITRRNRELKGFNKVWLEVGEEKTVCFTLGKEELGVYAVSGGFKVEKGVTEIFVGKDSQTENKTEVTIE